jgi:hypothetical protein
MPLRRSKHQKTPKHLSAAVYMPKNVQLHATLLIQILACHLLSIGVDDAFHQL